MYRNKIRSSAMKLLDLDTEPTLKPKNYKFNADNCNCNKGLLPAKIHGVDILIDSVEMYKAKLNQSIIINGVECIEIDTNIHKITCKVCNQFVRF